MAEFVRRVSLQVSIDGHDVAGVFAPYLLDLTFTDNASGKADDLQISLRDSDGRFSGGWRPKKGMEVKASIICHDWEEQGEDLELPCGSFTIDEVELSGPPDKIQIKAVSASLAGGLRDTRKTKAWENISLKQLAGQIAEANNLELMYFGEDQKFERQDQRNESDISFLDRVAGDCGMACKAHDGKLVLFDSEEAGQASAILEIPKTGGMYSPKSYSFKIASSGSDYDKAEVAYTDPKTGKTQTAQAKSAGKTSKKAGSEKTLTVSQRVENPAQAQKLARAKLHKANQKEQSGNLEIMGCPKVAAGRNVELIDFGEFSGSWCVKSASHKVDGSGGYSTSLELESPAPTMAEKTESFAEFTGEQKNWDDDYDKWTSLTPQQKAYLEYLRQQVIDADNELDATIFCWPKIALQESKRCLFERDKEGWKYLSEFAARWLSLDWRNLTYDIEDKTANIPPSRIPWKFIMKFPRAEAEYERFTSPYLAHYVIGPAGQERLCEVLQEEGFYNLALDEEREFNFINYPCEQWKKVYVNYLPVSGFHCWPDGLMASLQSFTFRGLMAGTIKRIEEKKYHIEVKTLAIFAHDVFNFEGTGEALGFWSCVNRDFSLMWFGPSYKLLWNSDFVKFSNKYHTGANFLVLSDAHIVEDFRGESYDCPK